MEMEQEDVGERLTWTEAGGGLRSCVDGNGEGVAGANHLLGGRYAAGVHTESL